MKAVLTDIYLDLCKMRRVLRKAQFSMTKADRIIYGTPALELCGQVMTHYAMSYDFKEERDYYFPLAWAEFGVLRADLREIAEENIICSPRSTICPSRVDNPRVNPDSLKIELFSLLAKIDEGFTKLHNSYKNGKQKGIKGQE